MTNIEKSLIYWTHELRVAQEWRVQRKTPKDILINAINYKILQLEDALFSLKEPTVFSNRM